MENQRIILFFALSFVLLLIWQAWQQDYGVQPSSQAVSVESAQTAAAPGDIPMTEAQAVPDAPASVSQEMATPTAPEELHALQKGQRIHVVTDVLDVEIDSIGGDIRQVGLLAYPVAVDTPDKPFRLMEDKGTRLFIAQSGLLSKQAAADHHTPYSIEQTEYRLADGKDSLSVPLRWTSENGVTVTKTLTFQRDSYLIDVDYSVQNASDKTWLGNQYAQLQRSKPGDGESSIFIYTYTGGVIYSEEEKYEKIDFDEMSDINLARDIKGGWAAMIQHYFLGAWLPKTDEVHHYYSKALGKGEGPYVLGMVSPQFSVEAGQTGTASNRFFVGPKEPDRLTAAAEGLELTVDYGFLTFLSQPLFWLLDYINDLVGNWGWSIVILTIIIKLAFYKLSETSYKSMANMRRLQPKITALKERYGDDRQRMSQGMMEMYKKEKINPLGGCLPMLVQIPVFIALYWALLESVDLRQAEFILWIKDMSAKDPYYILPLLMGGTMYIQQKLNPAPPDPVQAKVMMSLPFIFTFFFAFFPAGLVLYWVANGILSILQQWYITRKIEKAAKTS